MRGSLILSLHLVSNESSLSQVFYKEVSYPDLASITESVDVVDIFRRSEEVPDIVEDAIKIGAKAVWMQEGVINEAAAARAREAGLKVVMDKCMFKEHQKLSNNADDR